MPPPARRPTPAATDGVAPKQAKPLTKRDRIAIELRRMISEGELPRGSRIQQDVLAAMFDTSITPVREALRLLEAEGDRARLNATNHRFHFLFYANCGNDGLADEIDQLWQKLPWDVLQVLDDRADETSNEHRGMLAAARLGDGNALAKATEWHLARSFLAVGRHLTGQKIADPFEVDND
jgi:DNA-binding GntR family transcriptional regulator